MDHDNDTKPKKRSNLLVKPTADRRIGIIGGNFFQSRGNKFGILLHTVCELGLQELGLDRLVRVVELFVVIGRMNFLELFKNTIFGRFIFCERRKNR